MTDPDYTIPNDGNVSPDDIQPNTTLVGSNLSDARLVRAELSESNLVGSDLSGANLTRSNLANADLMRADLMNADFPRADLTNTNFQRADLRKAFFGEADLSSAHLRSSNLTNADFRNAELSNANLKTANLSGANLESANLPDANLEGADLSGANLEDADLSGANLENADLSEANLKGAEFSNIDLRETPLPNAALFASLSSEIDADLREVPALDSFKFRGANPATLIETDLRRANLEDADLGFTDLREATLIRADCENTQFDKAKLTRATLENADLTNANFSQAYLYQTRLDGAQINDQTQFHPAGDVGDHSTPNACRYDSEMLPATSATSIECQAMADTKKNANEIRARRARSTYGRLEELARENGFPDFRSQMYIRRQDARKELLSAQGQRSKAGFAQLQRWLFVYGESFSRILVVSGITIGLFWVLFSTTGTVETTDGTTVTTEAVTDEPELIWETLYHSLSLFFAGSGPLSSTGTLGQVLTVSLFATGPILLALLIFVLGRRAAR